jgi:hypothetical protein
MQHEKSGWPFAGSAGQASGRGSAKQTADQERAAEQAALRARMRHDRLIVGGRAHAKKHGLS